MGVFSSNATAAKDKQLQWLVLGCEPVTWMSGSMSPPLGTSEYDVAGAYRGAPVEIVHLPLTGLPVRAGADLVVEGFIPPIMEETAYEGPSANGLATTPIKAGNSRAHPAHLSSKESHYQPRAAAWAHGLEQHSDFRTGMGTF